MKLTDEQRKRLNGEIYEYLLVQQGEDFARAAHSFFLACPDDCVYYKSFQKIKDASSSKSDMTMLENRWLAVNRLQERFAQQVREEMETSSKQEPGSRQSTVNSKSLIDDGSSDTSLYTNGSKTSESKASKAAFSEEKAISTTASKQSVAEQKVSKNANVATKSHAVNNNRRHYLQLKNGTKKVDDSTSSQEVVDDERDPKISSLGFVGHREVNIQEHQHGLTVIAPKEQLDTEKNSIEKKKVEFNIEKKTEEKKTEVEEEEDWDPIAPWTKDKCKNGEDWESLPPGLDAAMKEARKKAAVKAAEEAFIRENPEPKLFFFF